MNRRVPYTEAVLELPLVDSPSTSRCSDCCEIKAMLGNILSLALTGLVAFVFSVAVWLWRRKSTGQRFSDWWDSEGVPIWITSAFLIAIIFCSKG
jgi:hypothetical protein